MAWDVQMDLRKNFVTKSLVQQRNRLPETVGNLEDFQELA